MKEMLYKMSNVAIWLLTGMCLYACSMQTSEHELLDRIESLWVQSDSDVAKAVRQSERLGDSVRHASEYVRMKYDLLCIRLRDKQYVTPYSADSARRVMEYFKGNGNCQEQMRAHFYMGSTYRDLHDYPQAITNFLIALEIAKLEANPDTAMWLRCYSQLATAYAIQLNLEESLQMAQEKYELAKHSRFSTAWDAMDMAEAYIRQNDTVTGVAYLDEAYDQERKNGYNNYMMLPYMLHIYSHQYRKERADSIADLLRTLPANCRPRNYDINFASYFDANQETDSAIAYYLRCFDVPHSINDRGLSSLALTRLYYQKADLPKAMKYAFIFQEMNDSAIAERQFDLTRNARGQFLYLRDKEAETAIMHRSEQMQLYTIIIGCICVILVLCMYLHHYKKKKSLLEVIVGKNLQIKNLEDKSVHLSSSLREKEAKLRELVEKNHEMEDNLRMKMGQNNALMKLALMAKAADDAAEVVEKFRHAAAGKGHVTEAAWKKLFTAVDTLYPTFKDEVQNKISRLTVPILRTCYLLKVGMTNSQIEHLMDVPRQTVWYRVCKIEKMLGTTLRIEVEH